MKHIKGKTVLLTGAASGIGEALAIALANQGCHLYLVDVNEPGLEQLRIRLAAVPGIRVWSDLCDLNDSSATGLMVERAIKTVSAVDVLINNAGIAWYGQTQLMSDAQFDRLMRINLLAPIQITQLLLPHFLKRPESHIVNMCSISGLVAGGRFAAYHTSKFGLIGYTEAIRAEFGRHDIGVSAICPGPVLTKLYQNASSDGRGHVPTPPAWICTTAEIVAAKTIRAIQRNQRQVLVSPLAHLLFQLKRFAPGLIDAVNQFSRNRKKRRAARLAQINGNTASGLHVTVEHPETTSTVPENKSRAA
ncbi:MAG: SDR family NAD(P)-dependent oxidoreductase [Planctomyces sp.]|nr:SDR family NAD(P)-dependent oxidoreductase [Planctomyces sp.]